MTAHEPESTGFRWAIHRLVVACTLVLGTQATLVACDEPAPDEEQDPIAAELRLARATASFHDGEFGAVLRHLETLGARGLAPYYRGLALLSLERPAEAVTELELAKRQPDAPAEIDYDLGVARYQHGDARGAAESFTAHLRAYPDDAHAHFFLGFAMLQQGRRDEGIRHLRVAGKDPSLADRVQSAIAQSAAPKGTDETSARLRSPADNMMANGAPSGMAARDASAADKRWNLTFLTGFEYDSNVPLSPDVTGLGASDENDSRWVNALFGEYRFVQEENWNVGVIASALSTTQFDLNQFDVQDYMGGAYTNRAFGDFILGVNYQFHETLLDGEQFSTDHRLVPSVSMRNGQLGHTTAYYEFDRTETQGAPVLIPAQRRTGDFHSVGLTEAIYLLEGKGRLYFGYRFEDALTDGSDFDHQSHMVSARVEVPVCFEMIWDAEVRHFWDGYDHANSLDFRGRQRDDRRVEVRTGLQKVLSKHLSLRVDYTFVNNDSNVENLFGTEFYSYDRHVVSTQLILDF